MFDNLVVADRMEITRTRAPPITVSARFPQSLDDIRTDFEALFADTGLRHGEASFLAERLWQVLTSCADRMLRCQLTRAEHNQFGTSG